MCFSFNVKFLKHVLFFGLLFFGMTTFVVAQSLSESAEKLAGVLNGRFVISDKPDDFKVNFIWINELFSHPKLGERLLYHKRVLSHAPDKPLVQLLMQVSVVNEKLAIQYYAFKKSAEQELNDSADKLIYLKTINPDKVVLLEEQTMYLELDNKGTYSGKAEYPTIFRGSDFGKIEMEIKGDVIYNWTRYFKKDGTLVYGPKERGYYLKKAGE
jgi:hypothetical protein